MLRFGAAPPGRALEAVKWWLADTHRIRCLGPLVLEQA
jgi:hypothetical protein